ncbi:glycoside hydrolase [Chloropicon primus]|uniref:Glycoside hydrolase n=2 Tax=Chloropicon primus TaxID=1764295 RepID=A0A5B8MD70_9CHLO|nr:glycoside hydrolase [Chloropicon primus]UPQ97383.1 glycoside hydrolase [Chloropicon primus]|eukprot:QDZ18171.1 glycoside hydrolase [Chloropicon primus]
MKGGMVPVAACLLVMVLGSMGSVCCDSIFDKSRGPFQQRGYQLVVDVSSPVTAKQWSCLRGQLEVYQVIVRAWRSLGTMDANANATIAAAHAAGIDKVDVYMFPCIKCLQFEQQVDGMLLGLETSKYDRVWLDVEGVQYWTSSCDTNLQYFEELMAILVQRLGVTRVGVYVSPTSWKALMCDYYTPFSSVVPLWYPHYDNNYGFQDFPPAGYGGWSHPSIKQYLGSASACDASIDISSKFVLNPYPNPPSASPLAS